MNVIVTGYVEVEPMEAGSTLHRFHLLRGDGKRACKCRYGKGRSAAVTNPKTILAEMQELKRAENGHLYIEEAEEFKFWSVALCPKSETTLRKELEKWQMWEQESSS